MLRIADAKAAAANVNNIKFEQWDVENEPVPATEFDVVMGHSILHLVEDVPLVLEKVHALLNDGGVFVSSTGCLADKMGYLRPVIGLMKLIGKAPYVGFLKAEELEAQMNAAGFQTVHSWRPKGNSSVFNVVRKI
jgi:ubiquinone/menaquinone biosynthesis C-methylase UbiE